MKKGYLDIEKLTNEGWLLFRNIHTQNSIASEMRKLEYFAAPDVVEVVRCKDCYYWTRDEDKTDGFCLCDRRTNLIEAINLMAPYTTENDYCSWGERKEDET